jgi:hypothetical protein
VEFLIVNGARLPTRRVFDAFHGKPPRLFFRMLNGDRRAWGEAARAPREEVQNTLRAIGLEMNLVEKGRPGNHFLIGEICNL